MNHDAAVADLLERSLTRVYGKYAGTVTEVDEATMRVKAKVLSVFGDQQASGWCMPCVPYAGDGYGFAFLPEVGCGVWIEFEGGDISRPIWSGCYWIEGTIPEDAKAAVKVLQTKGGAKFVLDDDGTKITITDSHDNEIVMESAGITLKRGSMKIEITTSAVKVNSTSLEVT
ncbi:MAG TPA: phage baseplate assembly protein V [Thermoanaerobaculia bacterium]